MKQTKFLMVIVSVVIFASLGVVLMISVPNQKEVPVQRTESAQQQNNLTNSFAGGGYKSQIIIHGK